jgi:ATP-dependent helicase/DNAse subunit B
MKKLQLSASQFKMFKSCPRKHYFRYKEKIKEPTTKALKDGLEFHSIIENILLETPFKKTPSDDILTLVQTAFEVGCMDFEEEEFYVEKKIKLDIDDFHYMIGFIDLLLISPNIVTICDHKTIKSVQWGLTKDQLKCDLQMMVYGKWVIENYPVDIIRFRHNQINKEDPLKSTSITVDVTIDEIESYWKKILKVSPHIDLFRKKEVASEVATRKACNDYGGCYYYKIGKCSGHVDKLDKNISKISNKYKNV